MNKTQKRAMARDASRLLDFFGDGSKWTQGAEARKEDQKSTSIMIPVYDVGGSPLGLIPNPEATCFCLTGAMKVLGIDRVQFEASVREASVPTYSIISFNDHEKTTFTTVRRWLKRLVKAGS